MKLVQILARELVEWPERASMAVQDEDGEVKMAAGESPITPGDDGIWVRDVEILHEIQDRDVCRSSDHATAIVTRADWEAERARLAVPTKRDSDYVCWMRDRITEIDATTQALTTERAELVQKLASEGFALIGRHVEPVEDMSDWRNWKAGDLVERIGDDSKYYSIGGHYAVERTSDSAIWLQDDTHEGNHKWTGDYIIAENFKFHSRPSA